MEREHHTLTMAILDFECVQWQKVVEWQENYKNLKFLHKLKLDVFRVVDKFKVEN